MSESIKLSLLENAYSFLEEAVDKAIAAEDDPKQWKFAILYAVQSAELLLKECLRREHPALLFQNIDRPGPTVDIETALERLANLTAVRIDQRDRRTLLQAKKWRNQIIHYEYELRTRELKVAFATLLGFTHHFSRTQFGVMVDLEVLKSQWDEVTAIVEYAQEVLTRVRDLLDKREVWECPSCFMDAFVVLEGLCYVCGRYESVRDCHFCGERIHWDELEELGDDDTHIGFAHRACLDRDHEEYQPYW
jgi:HEPN domain-containing protein